MSPRLRRITHGRTLASAELQAGIRGHPVAHEPRKSVPEHSHASASVSLVLTGAFEERRMGEPAASAALDVLFKPPGLPHASATGAGTTRTITLALEPSTLHPELAAMERAVQVSSGPAAAALLQIAAVLSKPQARHEATYPTTIAATLDELTKSLLLAHASAPPDPLGPGAETQARLTRAQRHLGSGASVRRAAEAIGMHPVALARAFQRRFGCSPTAYRRRRQVARAAGVVPGARGRLAAVAQAVGFADQAHLTRAFRRETGLTPGAYGALVAGLFRGA